MGLLLVSVLLTACGHKEQAAKEDDVIESLLSATVMITVGDYRASGVIIGKDDKEMTIASVAHLMSGYDQGIVRFASGDVGFADVFCCDEASDIAILSIRKEDCDEAFYDSIHTALIDLEAYERLTDGDEVILAGSSVNVAANVMKGTFKAKDYYVPEYDQYLMYLYADAFEGMSGGGVVNLNGELMGLVCAASDNSEVLCIPVTDIINKWRNEK